MVTQVTLGSFFSLNGKTVLGGAGGSGLDTKALIASLSEAKRAPAVYNEDLITINDEQSSALGTFQSLLSSFRSASAALRNPPGVGNAADNAFQFTKATIISPGSDYFSVTTAAGATAQSYNISNISSVASAANQGTGSFQIADADESVVPAGAGPTTFAAGTITFNGQDITIEADDSLNAVAAKFNAVSDLTGVRATVVRVDTNDFQLSFVATNTGTANNFDLSTATDPSGVLTNIGLTAAVVGTNAEFELNGIAIVRQSNTVSDVVTGLTINILQETPDAITDYRFNIEPDTTIIQSAINNFINTYNAIKAFEAEQLQLNNDGTYSENSKLAQNQTFLTIMNNLNAQIASQVAGITGSNPSSLADVGITFTSSPATSTTPEVNNILTVNDGTLTSALTSNFNGVKKLFGFSLTSNNSNLTIFRHTNSLAVSSFSLTITPGSDIFTATYDTGGGPETVNLTATALTGGVNGYTLKGLVGTALEGLELIYASTANATISVTATQGIADKIFNTNDVALKTNGGILALELARIEESTARLNEDIATIDEQVAIFTQQLVAKFSALEQAIARTNNLLQSLNANQQQQFISASS